VQNVVGTFFKNIFSIIFAVFIRMILV
jgi:hypothetical protein